MTAPWAKRGSVVEFGQSPWPFLVLRRRSGGPAGVCYDLQAIMPSGLAGVVRGVPAWRCRLIPRPPPIPGPDRRSIEDIARAALERADREG